MTTTEHTATPTVRTRSVGMGLDEVYSEHGDTRTALGRVKADGIDATPGYVTGPTWSAYNIIGTRIASGLALDDAIAAVVDAFTPPAVQPARTNAERIRRHHATAAARQPVTTPKEPRTMQVDSDAITDTSGELVGISTLNGTMTLHAMDDPDPAVLLVLDDPAELLVLAAAAMAAALHLVRVGQHQGPDGNMPDQPRVARLVHQAATTAHQLSGRMLGLTR